MPKRIIEEFRETAHEPEPHAIASDGEQIWISSRATKRISVVDPVSWEQVDVITPPGMPWGLTYAEGALVMTCGEAPDDTRRIRRYGIGSGFEDGFIAAPDDAGSHLAIYDGRVLLGQWYNKRLLLLDGHGAPHEIYETPHQIAGVAIRDGTAYLLSTDDEENGQYWITELDLRRQEPAR
ncbi:MAG TPA: hypothetical protein VGD50_04620, partial [Candidatus Baltobacteraceae bacterium]